MNDGAAKEVVAIAGAGIAGLSAAIALKLAGFPVEIFEREQNPQAIGAGIQVGPNATRIMESWKLSLLGASFEPGAIELRNARSGALLNTVPLRPAARRRYGAPYITLLRKDLLTALFNRAQELGIPIRYACPVTDAVETPDGLHVTAGGRTFTAGALIGADGINSSVRQLARCSNRPVIGAGRGLARHPADRLGAAGTQDQHCPLDGFGRPLRALSCFGRLGPQWRSGPGRRLQSRERWRGRRPKARDSRPRAQLGRNCLARSLA